MHTQNVFHKAALTVALACVAVVTPFGLQPRVFAAKPPQAVTIAVRNVPLPHEDASRHKRYHVTAQQAAFTGDQPVVERANDHTFGALTEVVDDYIKDTAQMASASLSLQPTVTLARPDLISVYYRRIIATGSAHPAGDYLTFSYGLVNGIASPLKLSDLFVPGTNVNAAALSAVTKQLRAQDIPITSRTGGTTPPLTAAALKRWVITPTGVTFLFAAGTISTYADGDIKAHCRWHELESAAGTGKLSRVVKSLR